MARGKSHAKRANRTSLQNLRPDVGKFDPNHSKIKRLTDWDQEEAFDEEDEFFEGLDKVSLEQTNKDTRHENDVDIPDQVLDIDMGDDEEDEVDSEDEDSETSNTKKQRKPKKLIDNSQKGRFGKTDSPDRQSDSTNSDEGTDDEKLVEDDPYHHHKDSEQKTDNLHQSPSSSEEEDDESTWKSYHVLKPKSKKKKPSNDPAAIAEEAERYALELEEVKRLQKKARSKLIPADFLSYLDYASDDELEATTETIPKVDQNGFLPQSTLVKEFHSEPEAVAYLLKTKPECLALLNDFRRSLISLSELQNKANSPNITSDVDDGKTELNRAIEALHYHILASYVSTTAFYMNLSLKVYSIDPNLLASVTKALIDLRYTLNLMEQAGLIGDAHTEQKLALAGPGMFNGQFSTSEFDQELRDLLHDQSNSDSLSENSKSPINKGKRRKSKQDSIDLTNQNDSITGSKSTTEQKKKRRKKESSSSNSRTQPEDPNELLHNLPPRPPKFDLLQKEPLSMDHDYSVDFVEPSGLSEKEMIEKEKKKKTLRFYTAKIDAKGKRREKALVGAGTISGDSDLPYVSKESQRRQFLKQQDHTTMTEDDGNLDVSFEEDHLNSLEDDGESNYYDTIKELKLSAKKSKKVQYDEQRLAERDALMAEKEIGNSNGPREISREILKNKGLTPKRSKENRNPRVKKRKRFDKAQKKISSQRPTFKSDHTNGPNPRSVNGYSGEKSGVKVGLVKSRKL